MVLGTHLSGVRAHLATEMQEAVAVAAQVAALVAANDRQRVAVVVVITRRSRSADVSGARRRRGSARACAGHVVAGRETLDVLLIEDAQRRDRQPQLEITVSKPFGNEPMTQ